MFSSNIGTLQIAQRLTGPEFLKEYEKIWFTKKNWVLIYLMKKRCNAKKVWQFSAGDKDKKIMYLKLLYHLDMV